MNKIERDTPVGFYSEETCELSEFVELVTQETDPTRVPLAREIIKRIPVYDMHGLGVMLENAADRRRLMSEWAETLLNGAGVVVLRHAVTDLAAIDRATDIFDRIIQSEKAAAGGGADHFAAAGANDRVWNALQKLCEADPDVHMRYFASPAVDAVCEAWLGPNYQMTAQVNLVHPGGAAQQAHRDYHLGFQTAEVSAMYPAHVHDLSPLMTLQGGIAHGHVPLESGPTKLLPNSQRYRPGYAAWRRDDFRAIFEERHVQLPLEKGDALFFNPALFHAAGANRSEDIHRMVNLLQVSSAFGRAMETVDRAKMSALCLGPMQAAWREKKLTAAQLAAAIAATAEGYSFPTNLDTDPPIGGLAPKSQAALLHEAVVSSMDYNTFEQMLNDQEKRRLA